MEQDTYTHEIGQDFKKLPAIYQIEASSACNLKCPMCLRTTNMVREDQLLKFDLLELMKQRGDFGGSAYVELQMAGEPTLHPKLGEIIHFLKHNVGVMVGLSTHGLLIKKKSGLVQNLLELDALTISVDSLDPDTYHKMRYPAKIEQLLENLEFLFDFIVKREAMSRSGYIDPIDTRYPFIELQLIATDMFKGTGDVAALEKLMKEKEWDHFAKVRTTGDCFSEMQGRVAEGSRPRNASLCINPWTTVSVAQNGDVTSCCFIFEPKKDEVNYYGNLYEQSLEEIWNSDRVQEMRKQHMTSQLSGQCTKCYLKSPYLIHQNIISRLVRLG